VVEPVVQKDPAPQLAALAFVQLPQTALLLAENVPGLHATQLLSAVVEPVVQKDPAPQLAALAFVQLTQFAVTESANVPALQAAHEPAAVEEAPLNRGA